MPTGSMATPEGRFRLAKMAWPVSPLKPAWLPPAMVVMVLSRLILRTRLFSVSAI